MKVTLDSPVATLANENTTITYSPSGETVSAAVTGGYRLDITKPVMDNAAYGQGKTVNGVSESAIVEDLTVQRNYMAVMSNSMSQEDYEKMKEQGYPPASTDVEQAVTIVDRIKAELAESGVVITGYNDDLTQEQLEAITGSAGLAREIARSFHENDVPMTSENVAAATDAVKTGSEITELTESAMKYMVENKKAPTIENIYVASFSTVRETRQGQGYYQEETPGYFAKKATSYDWTNLNPQMERVIEDASLEVNEETLEDARWMITEGIALDADGLRIAHEVRHLSLPFAKEDLADAVASAISGGKKPMAAVMDEGGSVQKRARRLLEDTKDISEEAIQTVATAGYTLTLSQLIRTNEEIKNNPEEAKEKELLPSTDTKVIRARRKLEECRLHMTLSANIRLIREGYGIDTRPIEEVIERLKALEDREACVLAGVKDSDKAKENLSLNDEVQRKIKQIERMPAAVLGKVVTPGSVFTLNYIHVQGSVMQNDFLRANETYEAVGTQVRGDLGDSIKKAFRNVDDILKGMHQELSDENRRAVRILGYNRMQITDGSIQAVKLADLRLNRVLKKMTPAATLKMIRDGVNPLNTDIGDLEEYLSKQDKGTTESLEDMSRFLYKLEKNNEISESEREAYIGIYRLLHQIEASDGAIIGQLMNQGEEINFRNLLKAVRTRSSVNMDVSIDDEYLARTSDRVIMNSISTQIETGIGEYQKSLARDITDELEPERLKKVHIDESTTLEALDRALKRTEQDERLNASYAKEEIAELRTMRNVDESVIRKLLDYELPVTQDNLLALDYLSKYRGATYRRLLQSGDTEFAEAAEELKEHFDSPEEAAEHYEKLEKAADKMFEKEASDSEVKAIDVKSLALYSKQIRLATRLAKEEDYEIPINMKGGATSINLRILHGSGETGTVRMTMETEEYGKVEARFRLKDDTVDGFIGSESEESVGAMESLLADFKERLSAIGLKSGEISAMRSKNLRINDSVKSEEERVSTKELYSVARALIFALETI